MLIANICPTCADCQHPVAFLISFGIPGIPGELLLFAGPLAVILAIAPEMTPLFLALYLGLQIGLPDSFRTGANTTNNYVYCIVLNKRGGLVCLNSAARFDKWNRAAVR